MTNAEVTKQLRKLASEVGGDTPTYFRDRAFPKPPADPLGTAAEYADNMAKLDAGETATALCASGHASEIINVAVETGPDGKIVVCEYDSNKS